VALSVQILVAVITECVLFMVRACESYAVAQLLAEAAMMTTANKGEVKLLESIVHISSEKQVECSRLGAALGCTGMTTAMTMTSNSSTVGSIPAPVLRTRSFNMI